MKNNTVKRRECNELLGKIWPVIKDADPEIALTALISAAGGMLGQMSTAQAIDEFGTLVLTLAGAVDHAARREGHDLNAPIGETHDKRH